MDVIIGLGEVGLGLKELLYRSRRECAGRDLDPKKEFGEFKNGEVDILHICFPYTKNFDRNVINYYTQIRPKIIVVHSTVAPYTTIKIAHSIDLYNPDSGVFYSPILAHWSRMYFDLRRYTKFYAGQNTTVKNENVFLVCFEVDCKLKVKRYADTVTLELAKLLCNAYYTWQIIYGQLVDKVCLNHGIDCDIIWEMMDHVHEILGNRPRVYVDPKGIGGHCLLQNVDILEEEIPELKLIVNWINNETKIRHKRRCFCGKDNP